MGLYPVDLIATAALAWTMVFYNRLPTRFYRHRFLVRPVFYAAGGWCLIALFVPRLVWHCYFGLGLLTLWAGWLFHREHLLRGKNWLMIASSLGGSVGVVFILAETLEFYPSNLSGQVQFLANLYFGTAPVGLALTLFLLTRRRATEASLPAGWIQSDARLLLTLILLRGLLRIFSHYVNFMAGNSLTHGSRLELTHQAVAILLFPWLAWVAFRRIDSPSPSRSGPLLLSIVVLGCISEAVFEG